ncbi:hypothetical protein PV326_010789, partial [Microctonus aethiopoides]
MQIKLELELCQMKLITTALSPWILDQRTPVQRGHSSSSKKNSSRNQRNTINCATSSSENHLPISTWLDTQQIKVDKLVVYVQQHVQHHITINLKTVLLRCKNKLNKLFLINKKHLGLQHPFQHSIYSSHNNMVWILPHSNAEAERTFSNVRDIVTKKRNRIGSDTMAVIYK